MAARPGGMMEGQLKGEVVSQSARHHPMFIPGDFPGLPNELDVDDLVDPFNKFNDSDIVYEIPRIKAKTVGDGKYLKGDVLGEGAYSKVKEMLDCQLLRRRAVKIMKKRRLRKIPNGEQNVRR
jgi:serine/threonine-protein kinase 11